jgi:acetamidase/formamidase
MVGPFYVRTAEPGDALIINIQKLRPNRTLGFTRSRIAAGAVDPQAVPLLGNSSVWEWHLDLEQEQAACRQPGVTVPLRPMLGCLGVAAARGQSISTVSAGEHGGNMDFAEVTEGTRLHFPVFQPGGLFYLGDGHAAQGDGELLGTGIEVSMDVSFSVDIEKQARIRWPHLYTGEHWWTLGSARPVDQAAQHAVTEMLANLAVRYSLSEDTAHALLGTRTTLRIANFFNPTYTVGCGLPIDTLFHQT